jgi:hypothetical protein
MKKLLLLLGIVAATGSLSAITTPKNEKHTPRVPSVEQLTAPPIYNSNLIGSQKEVETPSAVTYNPVGWGEYGTIFSIGANGSPFAYDPASKSYYAAGMFRVFNPAFAGSRTTLYRLQNGKVLWDSISMLDKPGVVGGFYPALGVINPTKSTDAKDVSVLFYSPALKPLGQSWNFQGGVFLMGNVSSSAPFSKEFIIDEEFENVSNSFGTIQNWSVSRITGTSNDAPKQAIYKVGTLSPATGLQYGYYGFFGINDDGSEYQNKIPDQWNITNFRASTAVNSSFQAPMEIDTDPLGNVYAACFNFPVASGQTFTARVPMVSKSTDYGATWSNFVICPEDKLKEYAILNGYADMGTSTISSYQKNAFVVYGDDKYSFFFRASLLSEPTPGQFSIEKNSIMEARYDAGNWTIHLVADIVQTGLVSFERDPDRNPAVVFTLQSHPLGNELQASKTKDGQNIILKWIDANPNRLEIISPPATSVFQEIFNNPQTGQDEKRFVTVDSLDVTDVFCSYRNVSSGGWSSARNITDDNIWNHSTWIPPIVESLEDMALFSPIISTNPYPTIPAFNFASARNRITIGSFGFRTTFARFNLLTSSAGEEKPMEVSIDNVYPSIASNQASLEFTSPVEVPTTIEVTNINGEVVKTIFNGVSNVGQNLVGFTVNELPNGVYFATVKTGGTVKTSKFTVLK